MKGQERGGKEKERKGRKRKGRENERKQRKIMDE